MGPRQEAQAALFYEISLEVHVPQDHLLRPIHRFVDLDIIRSNLTGFYSHTRSPFGRKFKDTALEVALKAFLP